MRVALALALLAFACNGPQHPEAAAAASGEVLATVNGQGLTEEDLALQPAGGHAPAAHEPKAAILDALITEELAAQKAAELGLEPDAAGKRELARLEAATRVARRRALANAWYAQQARQAALVSADEVQQYFRDHAEQLRRQVHVLMAMRRSEAEIDQVRQALAQGTSLEAYSKAQLAGIEGTPWDVGWLGFASLPPQWRAALAAMKPGDTSGVLRGDHDRFWIIELVEEREAPELTLEAARPLITQQLAAERALPLREAAEARLRQEASVVRLKAPAE